jgi:N-acetylmuramoyl-L-alanine amidase
MMKNYRPILFKLHIFIILLLFMVLAHFEIAEAKSNKSHFQIQEKTIVIDPGHGGYDKGAEGPDGIFEKNVTMEFARVLALELEKTYKVILTRTDNYWIDILERTAMANHVNADMFISIHTGGSFLHQASGISLYYYDKISTSSLMLETESMEESKSSNDKELWSNIQGRHQKNSKVLAERILSSLKEKTGEKVEYNAEIQGAPLMVLEGADLPAVLIEIGYITNPKEEKSLNDIVSLSFLAQKVKKGIDKFFEKAP